MNWGNYAQTWIINLKMFLRKLKFYFEIYRWAKHSWNSQNSIVQSSRINIKTYCPEINKI